MNTMNWLESAHNTIKLTEMKTQHLNQIEFEHRCENGNGRWKQEELMWMKPWKGRTRHLEGDWSKISARMPPLGAPKTHKIRLVKGEQVSHMPPLGAPKTHKIRLVKGEQVSHKSLSIWVE